MQQFATAQTTLAASNIAFDEIQVNAPVSREANGTGYDQSQQRSAFEEALARQEKQAESRREPERSDSNRRTQSDDKHAEQAQLSRERARESQEAKNRKRDEQVEQNELEQARANEGRQSTENAAPTNRSSALAERHSGENKSLVDEQSSLDPAPDKNKAAADSALADNVDFEAAQKEATQKEAFRQSGKADSEPELKAGEEFNWVDYVDRIKDLSDKNISNDLYVDDTSNNDDFFKQALNSLTSSSSKSSNNDADLNVDSVSEIVTEETDKEFLEIHLSEKELDALLKASGIEKELSLHGDALEELDKAITSLLQQLMNKDELNETEPTDQEMSLKQEENSQSELDAALLKSLLLSSEKEAKPSDGNLSELAQTDIQNEGLSAFELAKDTSTDLEKVPQPIEGSIDEAQLAGIAKVKDDLASEKIPLPFDTDKASSPSTGVVKEEVLDESALISGSALASAEKSESKETKTTAAAPLVLTMGNQSAKKQLEMLTKLPAEAEAGALENITQRLETVVSDLKTEGKATEFIAALQSGVKEMKEQLKQGREPGIDLKALVNEALANADVKVPTSETAGVDKQLTQINSILSAASSINQSAQTLQSQNYLNTGLSEVQGVKEIAQQQLESTKLAQQTLNSDKAVNIFKPEGQQQLTEKVRWMVNSRNLSAEIRLDPPDLGGMNIKVNINGDSASVSFIVQSQQARDALDQAVPRLREMLEEQGIELGQSSVEQDSSGQDQQAEQDTMAKNANTTGNLAQQSQDEVTESQEEHAASHIEQRISGASIGGIDYYA